MPTIIKRPGRPYYLVQYFDASGQRREKSTKTTDYKTAEKIANKLQDGVAKQLEGLSDARTEARATAARRPIGEHLDEFIASLEAKGTTEKHRNLLRYRIGRVIQLCKAATIADLTGSAVMGAIAAVRRSDGVKEKGKAKTRASQKTAAYYLRDVKHFTGWLAKDGRAADNPLAYLTMSKGTENRRKRRAVEPAELVALVAWAEQADAILGMAGTDRAMLYRLLAGTGFRVSEAASLTPASFDLDADPPTVTIAAAYSKHRREDVQPIRADLAALLRSWLKGRPASAPVFALPDKPYELMKRDLKAARTAWIQAAKADPKEQERRQRSEFLKFKTSDDRFADLHSLRHTYISTLANANVPVKAVQELARHCDPRLTLGVYAHARIHDVAAALQALPSLEPAEVQQVRAALAATGTEDATAGPEERQQDRQQDRQQSVCEKPAGVHTSRATICETTENQDDPESAERPQTLRFPAKACDDLQRSTPTGDNPASTDPKSVALSS